MGFGSFLKKAAGPVMSIGSGLLTGGLAGGLGAAGSYASAQQAYAASKEGAKRQNTWNKAAAQKAMDFSAAEQALNRKFQVTGYRHRYQWQKKDMEQAGINPLLAYQQGAPGGPTGGAATGASYNAVNPDAMALPAVTTAQQGTKMKTEQRVMRETMKRINQDTKVAKQDEFLKSNLAHESLDRAHQMRMLARKIQAETDVLKQNLTSAKATAAADRHRETFFNTDFGKLMRQINLIGTSINPFANSAKTTKGVMR